LDAGKNRKVPESAISADAPSPPHLFIFAMWSEDRIEPVDDDQEK
jgi:hypothetical protein